MNVKWAKNVPSFTALSIDDQLLLLEESWRDLFVLGAVQFLQPIELGALVQSLGILEEKSEKALTFLQQVKEFQDILTKLAQLQVDPHEFACLRAIVLFKTNFEKYNSSETKLLTNPDAVHAIQDHTQLTLNRYISTAHPTQPLRFGRLLLLLPILKSVSSDTIEELFFRKTIGETPIVRIICDMYKTNPNLA